MAKLFSIKQKYSEKIFMKKKLVEFRRQNVNITEKEICLIYTSYPKREIEGYFLVEKKIRLPLKELWKNTKDIAGISVDEFQEYFEGCEFGTAILFKFIKKAKTPLTLEKLRGLYGESFRPPQSYCNLEGRLSNLVNLIV